MQIDRSTGAGKRLMPAAVALLIVVTACQACPDFNPGVEAYERGDYDTALKEFRPWAEQGDASAQFYLGDMYDKGLGVPQDYQEAARWYQKAAEQGVASAQFSLAVMFFKGQGVPLDYAEAVKWYRLAAEQRHAGAQNNLGYMYYKGQGVPQNYIQAHMWASLATAQGIKDSAKGLEILKKKMSPAQIAEAQRLSREWKPKQ